MKDKKTLFGKVKMDNYQHIILYGNSNEYLDLTRMLEEGYTNCFVKVEIEVMVDKRLEDAIDTNTVNDI